MYSLQILQISFAFIIYLRHFTYCLFLLLHKSKMNKNAQKPISYPGRKIKEKRWDCYSICPWTETINEIIFHICGFSQGCIHFPCCIDSKTMKLQELIHFCKHVVIHACDRKKSFGIFHILLHICMYTLT